MSILGNKKTRARCIVGVFAVGAIGLCAVLYGTIGPARPEEPCPVVDRLPKIRPDYCGVVLPPNIAPLNFVVEEEAAECFVRLHGATGEPIELFGKTKKIIIPTGPWHRLVEANRGGTLHIDVFVRSATSDRTEGPANPWKRF